MMHSENNLKAFFNTSNHRNKFINILMVIILMTLSRMMAKYDLYQVIIEVFTNTF